MFKPTGTGGTGAKQSGGVNKAPNEYTEQERINLYKTNPQLFKQIFG
jgi:hypothetical protein